ncbi:MAG TPA: dolichyl-phosphate beta-glucosyltransferase [Bryobacteraceae bacterium]|nr:dolichyl-phosphate beta-glucosyltransferase [Bryobacteraceae bacterium]
MHSLSIVIPAFNEEQRLPDTLDRITGWLAAKSWDQTEILVVDDGSRDGTAKLAESYGRGVRLLRNPGNRGKGYAVRHGMLEANGEWILYTDADLSAPIEEFDKLCVAAATGKAQAAIGSRALDRSLVKVHQAPFREYSGRFFNLVMRMTTGLPFLDTQCGFKLFRRDAAQAIFSRQKLDGFSFDVEDLYIAKKLGIAVVEVPVRWSNVEGTKVSLLSGLRSFQDLVLIRRLHG